MTTTTDPINQIATVDEQGTVKPIVIMLDELVHTKANNYRCKDRSCPCYTEAQRTREALPLNGNCGFSLLR